jgi:anti-sigma regulatory factor (Ser/Thr protein kinase)
MSTVRFEHEFEPTVDSVKLARRFVTSALGAWELDDLDEVACLLTSELATNAVRHAGTVYRVVVSLIPPEVEVQVIDGSPVLPEVSAPAVRAPADRGGGGLGLPLVQAFAYRWGSRAMQGGKEVWFTLLIGGPSASFP